MNSLNHGGQPMIQRGAIKAPLSRLKAMGFVECCEWDPDREKIVSKFADRCLDHEFSLCAFVVDDEVLYIGTSMKNLRARMRRYCKPVPPRATSAESKEDVCNELNPARRVRIFVLLHTGLLCCGGKGSRAAN